MRYTWRANLSSPRIRGLPGRTRIRCRSWSISSMLCRSWSLPAALPARKLLATRQMTACGRRRQRGTAPWHHHRGKRRPRLISACLRFDDDSPVSASRRDGAWADRLTELCSVRRGVSTWPRSVAGDRSRSAGNRNKVRRTGGSWVNATMAIQKARRLAAIPIDELHHRGLGFLAIGARQIAE
jgi:hypothetical protein